MNQLLAIEDEKGWSSAMQANLVEQNAKEAWNLAEDVSEAIYKIRGMPFCIVSLDMRLPMTKGSSLVDVGAGLTLAGRADFSRLICQKVIYSATLDGQVSKDESAEAAEQKYAEAMRVSALNGIEQIAKNHCFLLIQYVYLSTYILKIKRDCT